MKKTALLFAFAAALCAAAARAQGESPKAGAKTKEQRKAEWENGVKTDCAAEIAAGGVCAGLDIGAGLEKCLHENRAKLSDGCKAAVRPHRRGGKGRKGEKTENGSMEKPSPAPARQP